MCIGPSLRLIDFGIANKIELDHTSIERDICCGTVNYMAPEAIDTHEDKDYYKVHWDVIHTCLVQTRAYRKEEEIYHYATCASSVLKIVTAYLIAGKP